MELDPNSHNGDMMPNPELIHQLMSSERMQVKNLCMLSLSFACWNCRMCKWFMQCGKSRKSGITLFLIHKG